MTLAFPKRKGRQRRPCENGVFVHRDGREVCDTRTAAGRREYNRRKDVMFQRQGGRCSMCGKPMKYGTATFEHQDGRGMGGSRRDDRVEINGKPYNSLACWWCNALAGSPKRNP